MKVYSCNGYDAIENTFNNQVVNQDSFFHELLSEEAAYLVHPLTRFTSFLGLPNRKLNGCKEQSLSNVVKNFFGWEDHVSDTKKTVNVLKALLVVPFHIVKVALTTPFNIIRLVTEFFPYTFALLCESRANQLAKIGRTKRLTVAQSMELTLARIGSMFFKYWVLLIGKALTDPLHTPRLAIKNIREELKKQSKERSSLNIAKNVFFGTLNLAITIAAIALFPFAIKALAVPLLNYLPSSVLAASKAVISFLSPLLQSMGNFSLPVLSTSLFLTGIGVNKLFNQFIPAAWHTPKKPRAIEFAIPNEERAPKNPSTVSQQFVENKPKEESRREQGIETKDEFKEDVSEKEKEVYKKERKDHESVPKKQPVGKTSLGRHTLFVEHRAQTERMYFMQNMRKETLKEAIEMTKKNAQMMIENEEERSHFLAVLEDKKFQNALCLHLEEHPKELSILQQALTSANATLEPFKSEKKKDLIRHLKGLADTVLSTQPPIKIEFPNSPLRIV